MKKHIADKHIVVSVDIAVNKSGIAILDSASRIIHTEVLSLKASWDYYRKLSEILSFFTDYFNRVLDYGPKKIDLVLEGRLKRGFSGETLASIEGARVSVYHAFHLTVHSHEKHKESLVAVYTPDLVKEYFTGRGNASKSAMYSAATTKYSSLKKVKFQEDIFDAIYLGVYHLASDKPPPKAGKKRRVVAKRLKTKV